MTQKSINTNIPIADLDGDCFECRWNCDKNCNSSMHMFNEITLDVGLNKPIAIKYDCVEQTAIDTLHAVVSDATDVVVSIRRPYLHQGVPYSAGDFDGLHTDHIHSVEYAAYDCSGYHLDDPADEPDDRDDDCYQGNWGTEVSHEDEVYNAISDGGSSFPSRDYAKRRMLGDGSFTLESREIYGYIDFYVIYFMCAEDVEVTDTDSTGDAKTSEDPEEDSNGLVDYSRFLDGEKGEVFDTVSIFNSDIKTVGPNGAIQHIDGSHAIIDPTCEPLAFTRQHLRKNLKAINIVPKTNILTADRGLSPHDVAHGAIFIDNLRKGFLGDEEFDQSGFGRNPTDDLPDTAHFEVEEEDCSVVVVKVTSKIKIATVHEHVDAEEKKYTTFVSELSLPYLDDSDDKCKKYTVGETLEKDEWTNELECYEVCDTPTYNEEGYPDDVNTFPVPVTFTYTAFQLTIDELVDKLVAEYKDTIANKYILSNSIRIDDDGGFDVSAVLNPTVGVGGNVSSSDWLVNNLTGLIDAQYIPARMKVKSIARTYETAYSEEEFGDATGLVIDTQPTLGFSGATGFDLYYEDPDRSKTYIEHYISPVDINERYVSSGEEKWLDEDRLRSMSTGFVPQSNQVELRLRENDPVTELKVYHATFKPSDFAKSVSKELSLEQKYSTSWHKHSTACNAFVPNKPVSRGDFDVSSSQEDAYVSWTSFSSPFLSDNKGNLAECFGPSTELSTAIFTSNQDEYWIECHKKPHKTHKFVCRANDPDVYPGMENEPCQVGGWFITGIEYYDTPEWKSLAYTGSLVHSCFCFYTHVPYSGMVPFGVACDWTEYPAGGRVDKTVVGPAEQQGVIPSSHLVCNKGSELLSSGFPPRFDTQRVQDDFILDHHHRRFRNVEIISEAFDYKGFFNENFQQVAHEDYSTGIVIGSDCRVNDEDIRHVQIRKKEKNQYGIRTYSALGSMVCDAHSMGAAMHVLNPSIQGGDDLCGDCYGWIDASTQWDARDSCTWMQFVGAAGGGTGAGGSCNPMGAAYLDGWLGYGESTIDKYGGKEIPKDANGFPNHNATTDQAPAFEHGYKWYTKFDCCCGPTCSDPFRCDIHNNLSDCCCEYIPEVTEIPERSNECCGETSMDFRYFFGGSVSNRDTPSAPWCHVIDFGGMDVVIVQPVTIRTLTSDQGSSGGYSDLTLKFSKEGI